MKVLGVPAAAALLALCGSAMARPNASGIYVASGGGTIETMQIIDEGDGEFAGSYSEYDVNHNKRYNGTIKGVVGDDGFVVASLSPHFSQRTGVLSAIRPGRVTLRPCGLRQRRGDADAHRAAHQKGLRRNAPISAAQNALDGQAVRLPGNS